MKLSLHDILIEQTKYSSDVTTNKTGGDKAEKFKQNMLKTVGAYGNINQWSYPEIEKEGNTNAWLNTWARDFIKDFSKNEIDKVSPGSCKVGFIQTYKDDYERKFGGKYSLVSKIKDTEDTSNKFFVCSPRTSVDFNKPWDFKFNTSEGQIGWYQLLQLDWGSTNQQDIEKNWTEIVNFMKDGEGRWCTYDERGGEICKDAVYVDPLTWFKDPHNLLTFFEIVTVFIPIVGPVLSGLFGMGNAALYLKEGDKREAAIAAFFSILPAGGAAAAKVIEKLGQEGLETLSEKIIKQNLITDVSNGIKNPKYYEKQLIKITKNFTESEAKALKIIVDNSKQIEANINKLSKTPNGKKQLEKLIQRNQTKIQKYLKNSQESILKTSTDIQKIKGLKSNVDTGIQVGGVAPGIYGKEIMDKLKPTFKSEIEKIYDKNNEYFDWNYIKKEFGSSGNATDNSLLYSAIKNDWRPGEFVPDKYQTNLYKQNMAKKMDNETIEIEDKVFKSSFTPEDQLFFDNIKL